MIFGTFSPEIIAQIIDEKEVPLEIVNLFNRRFRRATDPVWEMKGENYAVNFVFRDKRVYAEFLREGRIALQRTELTEDDLRPNTQQYLRSNYRRYNVVKAEYIEEHPRTNYYYVEVVPRRHRGAPDEEPPVTQLYFAQNGVFQNAVEPGSEDDDESEQIVVPPDVLREFNRRVRRANNVEWTELDTAYRADFVARSNEGYIIISPEGDWQLINIRLDIRFRNLHAGIRRWFDENISSFRFKYVEEINEAPRNRYYNVVILDRDDEPLPGEDIEPTHIHFTRTGRHIATFYPDYDVIRHEEEEDRRWARTVTDETLEELGSGFGEKDISRRGLPSKAQEFLINTYDHEWRTDICRAIEDEEYGTIYYVQMRRQGRSTFEEHYFDLHGNLIEDWDD